MRNYAASPRCRIYHMIDGANMSKTRCGKWVDIPLSKRFGHLKSDIVTLDGPGNRKMCKRCRAYMDRKVSYC